MSNYASVELAYDYKKAVSGHCKTPVFKTKNIQFTWVFWLEKKL